MSKLIPWFILIGFFSLLILSVIFISRKVSFSLGLASNIPMYLLFSGIVIFFLTAGLGLINSTSNSGHLIYQIATISMGVYLFLLMSVLLTTLIHSFYPLKPAYFGLSLLLFTLGISLYGWWNAFDIKTTKLEVPMKGLQQEIKAVHLTDVHIGHFRTGSYLDNLVDQSNQLNPDVVFITRDYLDSKYALDYQYFAPLKNLKAPVYFVDGNHDHATQTRIIKEMMRKAGVRVLDNQVDEFMGLQVIGLTHMLADRESINMHASANNPTISETLPRLSIDKSKPSVLLHHSPDGIKYASKSGVNLYLAGHTHAGQIFPFNYIAALLFDYNKGLHQYENTKIFVSQGTGTFGPPFRLGTRSEVIDIKLIPSE